MRTTVDALPRLKNRLKRLERKYRTAVDQVQMLIEQSERALPPNHFMRRLQPSFLIPRHLNADGDRLLGEAMLAAHWLEHYIHPKPALYVPPEMEGSDK